MATGEAAARKLEIPEFLESRHRIAFLRGDRAGMEWELALSTKKPEMEAALSYMDSFARAYSGHLQQARVRTRPAFDLAQQTGHPERAALYAAGAAIREAFFGNAVEARQRAKEALALSASLRHRLRATSILVRSGESR